MTRLSIFSPSAGASLKGNVFGKDVANFELFKALVVHGGFETVDFLMADPAPPERVSAGFGLDGGGAKVRTAALLSRSPQETGTVLRGAARLSELAWRRQGVASSTDYSLIGLIHTLAPPSIREEMAQVSIAPVHPWDALVCTSPSVQAATSSMLDAWEDHLASRTGGRRPPRPHLPLIPLGVDLPSLSARADAPGVRARMRQALGVGETDIVLLWVGRLSFFEKAFPQPMMRAAEEAARTTGAKVHFVMAGWFPDPKSQEPMYREAAKAYAPSVAFHVVDGADRERLADLWGAADIFISLVDNIQETFGITPVEAMASGLPVVVSDWDGYRYTVRDGEEGFLIPTLGGPPGMDLGELTDGHLFGLKTYQQYVGVLAQHTAVHVGRAAEALAALIRSPDLRSRVGAAGRGRVRTTFDWTVVAPQYAALAEELGAIRRKASGETPTAHPLRGDPFGDFAGFASTVLGDQTRLHMRPEASAADLQRASGLTLDMFGGNWRGTPQEAARCVERLSQAGALTVAEILSGFPEQRRDRIRLTLGWLAKIGVVDWL
ncbi:MAG: glycosyltransferase family 4 protein [Perlucidibaca sp.]